MSGIIEYPYRIHVNVTMPIIPITINNKIETYALVDSGASVSVFEADIIDALNLKLETGKKRFLQGIGGRILAYEHHILLKIADFEIRSNIAFSRELNVSLNILGQNNFFDHFIVIFQKSKNKIRLKKT